MENVIEYKAELQKKSELDEAKSFWQAIGDFNSEQFDRKPKNVRKHKTQGFQYVPIEQIEADLDSIFNGQWEYYDFTYQAIGNEITGSLTLRFFHPVSKQWLRRVGAGAVQVRFKKDTDILDIRNKITTALQMDLPHLKSECLKNAVQSIGRVFGRNLRREEDIEIENIYKEYPEEVKDTLHDIEISKKAERLKEIYDNWEAFKHVNSKLHNEYNKIILTTLSNKKNEILRGKK